MEGRGRTKCDFGKPDKPNTGDGGRSGRVVGVPKVDRVSDASFTIAEVARSVRPDGVRVRTVLGIERLLQSRLVTVPDAKILTPGPEQNSW